MNPRKFISFAFLLLAFVGCSNGNGNLVESNTSSTDVGGGALPPTWTPTPYIEPSTTMKSSLTPEPPAIPNATFTPITLSNTEIQATLEYFSKNETCLLPCWWGLSPGETTIDEIYTMLAPLASQIVYDDNVSYNPDVEGYYFALESIDAEYDYFVLDDKVVEMRIHELISIQNILASMGEPKKIFLRAYRPEQACENCELGMGLALYYPDDRLAAVYYIYNAKHSKELITGCFNDDVRLVMWSEEIEFSIDNFFGRWETYPTFEEATGMSIEEFHRLNISTGSNVCVSTYDNVWSNRIYSP